MPDTYSNLLTPTSILTYDGENWRIESVHPKEYHLEVTTDPSRIVVIQKSEMQALISSGKVAVQDEIVNHLDFSIMSEATRKRTISNLLWVHAAERARWEGKISNYSRSSLTKLIEEEAPAVSRRYKDFLADHGSSTQVIPRKSNYGAFSARRSNTHHDVDPDRLKPCAKTLEGLLSRWEEHRHIQSLMPNWGNQVGGGREIDPRTWLFIEKNCMRYARENNRTISACREFINALIVEENNGLGYDAQIPPASEHAVKKAIRDIPEFAKLFTRRGSGRMAQTLRHAGTGPRYTRLGEEVLFDCWDVHAFTILSDDVLAMFPNAVRSMRLTLCLAIDQATNYIPAFSVAPTGETAAIVCRALEMVGSNKKAYAQAAGAVSDWEGIPIEIAGADNGSAFWNASFVEALYVLADAVDHKAAGHKNLRAKIERLLREIDTGFLQNFVGRTGSKILDRHENDPEKTPGIYADFFMRLFIRYIVDKYHFTPIGKGRALRPSPARAVEAARKIQCKPLPGPHLQRLAHGTVTERTLNRAGIRFMNIVYYSTWLDEPLWTKGPHLIKMKYNPSNLGWISVLLGNGWVTIPGPRELEGKDLQTWLEYNDELVRQIKEQAEIDFREIVAPAILAIDAGARKAERDLNLTNLDWTDAMVSEAERRLRTFIVYDRDVIGAEKGLSGQSDHLGNAFSRQIPPLQSSDTTTEQPSPPREEDQELHHQSEGTPLVRKPTRTRRPIE